MSVAVKPPPCLLWERARLLREEARVLRSHAALLRAYKQEWSDRYQLSPDPERTLAYLQSVVRELAALADPSADVAGEHACGLCGGVRTYRVTPSRAIRSECANQKCPLPVIRLPGHYSLKDLNDAIREMGEDPDSG